MDGPKDIEMNVGAVAASQREEERGCSPLGDGVEEEEAPLDLSIRPEVRAEPADHRRLQVFEAERFHDISIDSGKAHICMTSMIQ